MKIWVDEHFNGVNGLIAELKGAGIMDENDRILDPRRKRYLLQSILLKVLERIQLNITK